MLLRYFPGACSRVTMIALEELGISYDTKLVDLRAGDQRKDDYLALNPGGTVPTLVTGELVLRENAAILLTLANLEGGERLLPRDQRGVETSSLIKLIWCSATLHPMVRQVRAPMRYTDGEVEPIRRNGLAKLAAEAERLDGELCGAWWLGDRWSIVDAYLHWAFLTAQSGGFSMADYSSLRAHADRVAQRPSTLRAIAREEAGR